MKSDATFEDAPTATGNRRRAVAAMLSGSAIGLTTLSGAFAQAAVGAKNTNKNQNKNRNKKQRRRKRNNGGKGGNGQVGGTLPSVRFVETSTTFTSSGFVSATSKCPDGYLSISGGFFSSVPQPTLLTSTPRLAQNDWLVEIDGANEQEQMTVTEICLAASIDPESAETRDESTRRTKRKRS